MIRALFRWSLGALVLGALLGSLYLLAQESQYIEPEALLLECGPRTVPCLTIGRGGREGED